MPKINPHKDSEADYDAITEATANHEPSGSLDMQQDTKSIEDEVKRKRDEEIKACFETAKQKLDGLLKSKKQVIQDLAHELERLGRRTEDIAAEIVAELGDCEEISKSLIYEYLDGKYKDPVHASKRKGKRKPVPETGTEPASEEKQKGIVPPLLIKKSASGLDVVDLTPEVNVAKTKVDADSDSNIDTHILQPQHKQSANTELGADSTMPQPQRTDTPTPVSTITTDHKDEKSQSYLLSHASDKQECPNLEFTILKEKYRIVRDAMDNSKASIVVKFDRNKNFLGAEPDVVFDISEANYQDGNVQQIQSDGVAKDKDKDDEHSNRHSNVRRKG